MPGLTGSPFRIGALGAMAAPRIAAIVPSGGVSGRTDGLSLIFPLGDRGEGGRGRPVVLRSAAGGEGGGCATRAAAGACASAGEHNEGRLCDVPRGRGGTLHNLHYVSRQIVRAPGKGIPFGAAGRRQG
jgi:hypothetical protein